MRRWVDIATLVKPHNQKGAFLVRAAEGLPFLLELGMEVQLVPPVLDAPRSVTVSSVSMKNESDAYVTFAEVTDGSTAHALSGCHCLALRELFNPEELRVAEAYRWDGWDVYDPKRGTLGEVRDVLTDRVQPLLEVERTGGETLLIPLVDEFIVNVDEENRRIEVSLIDGMLDL